MRNSRHKKVAMDEQCASEIQSNIVKRNQNEVYQNRMPRFGIPGRVPVEMLLCGSPSAAVESFVKSVGPNDRSRKKWTASEDNMLQSLVSKKGAQNWKEIADKVPGRTANQVRLRWSQHLSPSVTVPLFSEQDDINIIEMQKKVGNQWNYIAAFLGIGACSRAIKNRFNLICRRNRKRETPKYSTSEASSPLTNVRLAY
mmetsp:Transcript_9796/g.17658  ORF Transcript_9796/g.17658 Transcript_9796/m.17658 type:complete len:199 (-) Transcript_9796:639-1235(-)